MTTNKKDRYIKVENKKTGHSKVCDICHEVKPDVRFADLLDKWICSDCMGVPAFSESD
jgi:formylmethanofuran dehydrogenase subunit E